MQTFNEWKISECGQFFNGCIVPVEKSKALAPVYEEPSLYDKLFGGPEAMPTGEINKYHEEDDNSLNFETFKIFMGGDGSAPPAPGQRKKKRQSREEKDEEMMQLFKCFDKEKTGLVTIKNLRTISADFGTEMGEKELRQMIARAKESKCQGGVLPTNSRENVEKAPPGHRQLSQDTLKAKAARRAAKQEKEARRNPGSRPAQKRDKYELLGLSDDPSIDVSIIKQSYLDSELKFEHKKAQAKSDAGDERHFEKVTAAFQVLTNDNARKIYDSSADPQKIEIPGPAESTFDFFAAYSPIFAGYARFSKPAGPELGGEQASQEDVEAFYTFWRQFESWRDYNYLHVPIDTILDRENMSREEKRGIPKETKKAIQKCKEDEAVSIATLVEQASRMDPRLNSAEQIEAYADEVRTVAAAAEASKMAPKTIEAGPKQQSRGLQKLRNRVRSSLVQLKLSTDHTIEVADILMGCLNEDELANEVFNKLENTKRSVISAKKVVENIVSKEGRKKAKNKFNGVYERAAAEAKKLEAALAAAPEKPKEPKKNTRSKRAAKSKALRQAAQARVSESEDEDESPVSGGHANFGPNSFGASSSTDDSDADDHEELREKLALLRAKLDLAKRNDDFESCIALRDQINSAEQQLSQAESSGGAQGRGSGLSVRAQLAQNLALLQQHLAQAASGSSSGSKHAAAEAKQKSVLARIRTEQANVLEQLEQKSANARAEVAAIPSAVAQLQALLQDTDDCADLSQNHFEVQGVCENVLGNLRSCQPIHSKLGFDGIVEGARGWCQSK